MEELWINDIYYNPNIFYTFNTQIVEYDIKSAGTNIARAFDLIDSKTYKKLMQMSKDKRVKELGFMQRNDPAFTHKLSQAFSETRKMFITSNQLDSTNIISIKKDAIFTTKVCDYCDFLSYIEFRQKHEYSSYVRLSKQLELYYNINELTIKGIKEDRVELHEGYMLDLIRKFFYMMENDSPVQTIDFLRKFIDKYKRKELDTGYYRRFDAMGEYDLHMPDGEYIFNPELHKEYIDISYNLNIILLKLIKIPL